MQRLFALLLLMMAVAACGPLAQQPQVSVTPRPSATLSAAPAAEATADATEAATLEATVEATLEATEAATLEATVEATAEMTEAAVEATEMAAADPVRVGDAALVGDVALGEDLFLHGRDGAVPCAGCHSHDSDARMVGPGLLTVAQRAETRRAGLTAAEYLHQSIVDPSALVVAGYMNMMPKDFATKYSEADIDALVAYMISLGQPNESHVAAEPGSAG